MKKLFLPVALLAAAMFAYAPFRIDDAPYQSTMLVVQKIFYFHFATWMAVTAGLVICGVASALYLFKGSAVADRVAVAAAELVAVFTLFGIVSGSLWARKAWGVWWVWDARLTMSLLMWMVFVSYLLLRRYGGPGSETLAAGLALFGMATAPFVYLSVNIWRTIHPLTSVVPTLPVDFAFALWYSFAGFLLMYIALMLLRMTIERQRTMLDYLYLESEE